PAVDCDRAVGARVEPEGAAQRMDVAVEDEADDLARAVDHRAAGVAADDDAGGREIEALRQVQAAVRRVPLRGQGEGLGARVARARAGEIGEGRSLLAASAPA